MELSIASSSLFFSVLNHIKYFADMDESYTCEKCQRTVHNSNRIVHSVRCQRNAGSAEIQQTSVAAPQDSSRVQQQEPVAAGLSLPVATLVGSDTNEGHGMIVQESTDPFIECQQCTYHNDVSSDACSMCGYIFSPEMELLGESLTSPGNCVIPTRSRNANMETWRCESCSCENTMNSSFCYMCRNVRPPVQSYNEQLIGGASEEGEGMDLSDDRDANVNDIDEFANSIASSVVLGAGIGAGLAWLNRTDIGTGAMAGAGIGAISDVALWEFAAAERRRAQQQLRDRARAPVMAPAGRFVPPRGASVISLVDDEGTPEATAGAAASRRNGSSSSNSSNRSNRSNNSGRQMPPMNVEALLMQALASSVVARNGMGGTAGVGVRRGLGGGRGGGGGGWMDMAMNLDFDNLPYEMLLERFPAPPRGVDAATLDALPVRTYTEPEPSSSSSSSCSAPTASVNDDVTRSCSICLEEYARGDAVRTLPCLHCFHAPCVDHWLREHNTCPVCKHSLA